MNPFEVYVAIGAIIGIITWTAILVHVAREDGFVETMLLGVMLNTVVSGMVAFAWPLFAFGALIYLGANR
ncbi:hypothetical protein SEA_COLT_5 [Mycobacterium phage Colt]|uniref:Uncharacterized protein n=1 Tax=Mycobacterium phage Cane17 TaxID=2301548 RepID=A0A346N8I4_9CAUD|nr:hypothetical protein KHO59_gp005 [Mycobacterium phage Cane17]AXQ51619.1 hypothetical protein SEA_CANE17_5 [Mycobacterium phage Cane17]QAY13953.1 hypothetical protein SEA_COLT_5 [Mycobacterium phage Colt]